ncbi:hypothetical protein NVP1034O_67, partial [Vibrio phage 1.034.O._10N.261.46.B7]
MHGGGAVYDWSVMHTMHIYMQTLGMQCISQRAWVCRGVMHAFPYGE